MNGEKIFKAIGDIDDTLIERHNNYTSKKNVISWGKYIGIAAWFCIIIAGIVLIINNNNDDISIKPPTDSITIMTSESETVLSTSENKSEQVVTEITNDFSETYTDYTDTEPITTDSTNQITTITTSDEIAIIPKWNEMTEPEQYASADFNGITYVTTVTPAKADRLGEKIGTVIVYGVDEYTGELHSFECDVTNLIGISTECAVSIKLHNGYYVYVNTSYEPSTLGDFVTDMDLRNTVTFDKIYYNYFDENMNYISETYSGIDATIVWDMLLFDYSLQTICGTDYDSRRFINDMGISTNVDVIGAKNISIGVTSDGYVTTNILATGKAYYIGVEKVDAFIEYVRNNCYKNDY